MTTPRAKFASLVDNPRLASIERWGNYASKVARDNVIAWTDCGFGTSGLHPAIAPLQSQTLVEGARLSSQRLWSR